MEVNKELRKQIIDYISTKYAHKWLRTVDKHSGLLYYYISEVNEWRDLIAFDYKSICLDSDITGIPNWVNRMNFDTPFDKFISFDKSSIDEIIIKEFGVIVSHPEMEKDLKEWRNSIIDHIDNFISSTFEN